MAEDRRYAVNPQLDIQQILLEAKTRWLRPSEISEILRNYHRFNITPDPPYKPPGGSLFLFDRKALRYFRKDGHSWRKKKDGKTVREAHEKLKSGSIDVLHCYYAHGEDNENFQRRSYWLLDGHLEHIVLVHYRDLSEVNSHSIPHFLSTDPASLGNQVSSEVVSTQLSSSIFVNQPSHGSSTHNSNRKTQTSPELEDAESGDDCVGISGSESISCSGFQIASLPGNDRTEDDMSVLKGSTFHPFGVGQISASNMNTSVPCMSNQVASQNLMLCGVQNVDRASHAAGSFGGPSTWSEFLSLKHNHVHTKEQNLPFQQPSCTDVVETRFMNSMAAYGERIKFGLDGGYKVLPDQYSQPFTGAGSTYIQVKDENNAGADRLLNSDRFINESSYTYDMPQEHHSYLARPSEPIEPSEYHTESACDLKNTLRRDMLDDGLAELNKLDSFGRWMNKELGKDCDDSLMASDSCTYWNALDTHSNDKEVSSLSRHMQLDVDSVAPSLSQEQLFSILDFSPDWAFSEAETKVLISGIFLGGIEPQSIKWCCMFGEVEVSAVVLTSTTIRCEAPPHSPGRVPFYITCSNRLACSEVREFEYRENPLGIKPSVSLKNKSEDELQLQIRFAKMLSHGSHKKRLVCSSENCGKCNIKKILVNLLIDDEDEWEKIKESEACEEHYRNLRDLLLEKLLRGRLYEWLVCKTHDDGKGPNTLDEGGQGALHLAAALGYEWAMNPIVVAGVNPSFRDAHGRTALHWAAYYGREATIVTLLRLGAAPGAVEDPTSKFPEGQTAADLASGRGHKGIAGYLAEADLTSHLFSMTLLENVTDTLSATLAAENTVESLESKNVVSIDGEGSQISLRESLAAVRNSALAAARIQAAFRVQSFRHRQLTRHAEIDGDIMLPNLNRKVHRICHFNDSLHAAAIRIQQKYRGWKGRREFLKIRNRIVKIQAHVRGHQVRKQYKKVVWSVSIVEKAILRWRRKGSGLRGFRVEKASDGALKDVEKTDEYEFLRLGRKQKVAGIEKALARVRSMVRYPDARDQYMRLVASSKKSESQVAKSSDQLDKSNEENLVEKNSHTSLMN